MFRKHVKRRLLAYCNGELSDRESRRVSQHLLACHRCRKEYDQINLGVRLAGELQKMTAPSEIWPRIEDSLEASPQAAISPSPAGSSWISGWRLVTAAAALALMIVAGALIYFRQQPKAAWVVDVVEGSPKIGSRAVGKDGKLYVGQWLETDESSRVTLQSGLIGEVKVEPGSRVRALRAEVKVEPGSRVRALRAEDNEYRLSLERGEVQAKVSAPPRLFFVDTPSAEAIDLGCAYILDVDTTGAGSLHVTAGWVELAATGRYKSQIPAEAVCLTRPGFGPGTPYFEDASPALKDALAKLDFGGGGEGSRPLDVVLAEARKRDSLTLWHLLYRVSLADRSRVYDRLAELVRPPEGATKEMIMRLDPPVLDEWFLEIQPGWFE
jgi:anti-sigma factor ChrR (cupin superfamily)